MSHARMRSINEEKVKAASEAGGTNLRGSFGLRLRALRHHRLLSQRELATTSAVSMNTIGSIERGLRFPSPEVLESLSKALQVEVKEMFEIDDHAAPITLEGSAREICRVVNDDLLPKVEHLTALTNRLLDEIEVERAKEAAQKVEAAVQ